MTKIFKFGVMIIVGLLIIDILVIFMMSSDTTVDMICHNCSPNYIINGEYVYCGIRETTRLTNAIDLHWCSNGKDYYNVQNLVELPGEEK